MHIQRADDDRVPGGLEAEFPPFFGSWDKLKTMIAESGLTAEHFHSARLKDETQLNGTVVVRNQRGDVTAEMSRVVFESFLRSGSAATRRLRVVRDEKAPPTRGVANRHQRRAEAAKKRRGRR